MATDTIPERIFSNTCVNRFLPFFYHFTQKKAILTLRRKGIEGEGEEEREKTGFGKREDGNLFYI